MAGIDELMKLVASLELLPDMAAFDPRRSFEQNGIDSLDVMSVFLAAEERYGVKFSEVEAGRIDSLAALAEAIDAALRARGGAPRPGGR